MASKCDSVRPLESFKDVSGFELNNKLKPLDDALKCRICFDYFKNCMITKCSHNYCSVCIRRYMMHKAQCPTCFQDASEPELRNNRLIDEILRTYMKLKEMLIDVIPHSLPYSEPEEPVNVVKELPLSKDKDSSEKTQEVDFNKDEVSCPVCYKMVLNNKINVHLDSCLKNKEKEQYSERKTLPKLVYHLLSDKEIRKKLKEQGLNTSGDRQNLIRRHKNFLILYNANCDSLDPKPVADLLLEIEKQELEERLNSFTKPIQVNKKSDVSEIEREHEQYAKQHQSHFNALIQDVHQRNIGNIVVKEEPPDDFIIPDSILTPVPASSASVEIDLPSSRVPCQIRIENMNTLRTYGKRSRKVDFNEYITCTKEPAIKILETMSLAESKADLPLSQENSQSNLEKQPATDKEEYQEIDCSSKDISSKIKRNFYQPRTYSKETKAQEAQRKKKVKKSWTPADEFNKLSSMTVDKSLKTNASCSSSTTNPQDSVTNSSIDSSTLNETKDVSTSNEEMMDTSTPNEAFGTSNHKAEMDQKAVNKTSTSKRVAAVPMVNKIVNSVFNSRSGVSSSTLQHTTAGCSIIPRLIQYENSIRRTISGRKVWKVVVVNQPKN